MCEQTTATRSTFFLDARDQKESSKDGRNNGKERKEVDAVLRALVLLYRGGWARLDVCVSERAKYSIQHAQSGVAFLGGSCKESPGA